MMTCNREYYPLYELLDDTYETIHTMHSRTGLVTGYPTGFADLDGLIGGFQPGELIVIASQPSMGKSTLALNIAKYLSVKRSQKVATAIFSLEIPKEQLVMRLLSATASISYGRMRTGHLEGSDLLKLNGAKELLRQSKIYIDDTSGIDINELITKVRRLKTDHDVGLIIIDYLQLMRDESKSAISPVEISVVSRSLKTLARELNITIIVLSQLHRTVGKRALRPKLIDLRDAGSLENDADAILFVYRESVYCKKCRKRDGSCLHGHENIAEIIVAKQRSGAIGTVCLPYFDETLSFENLTGRGLIEQ